MPADFKTRERTEGAAEAIQAIHGDSFSANQIDPDSRCSTSFGVKAEPPALPCRDDILVENGTAAPKSFLSPLEIRSPAAGGGLLPTGMASTATRTTFDQPTLQFCLTEETNSRKSTQYTLYYNSSFWWKQLPAPFWCRVIQTKAKSGVRSRRVDRSSPRLPVLGNVARAALWGGSRFWSGWWRSAAFLEEG